MRKFVHISPQVVVKKDRVWETCFPSFSYLLRTEDEGGSSLRALSSAKSSSSCLRLELSVSPPSSDAFDSSEPARPAAANLCMTSVASASSSKSQSASKLVTRFVSLAHRAIGKTRCKPKRTAKVGKRFRPLTLGPRQKLLLFSMVQCFAWQRGVEQIVSCPWSGNLPVGEA